MKTTALAFLLLVAAAAWIAAEDACPMCAAETEPEDLGVGAWIAPDARVAPAIAAEPLGDQAGGTTSLAKLAGRPVALTFVYTRCANPNKCPRAMKAMAELQAKVGDAAVLAVATYDPEHDDAARFTAWATGLGFTPGPRALLLRPDPTGKRAWFAGLEVGVNFSPEGPNAHTLDLVLLDRQGRIARRYRSALWDTDAVAADLARLAAEPVAEPAGEAPAAR